MYGNRASDSSDRDTAFEIFPWSEHFEIGIAAIDRQHRKLVLLLNQVAAAAVTESVDINLDDLLDELAAYAHFHFEAEETIWSRQLEGEPLLSDHRQFHTGFVEKVKELRRSRTNRQETLHEILAFLTHWLARHILKYDREMALVLNHLDVGLSMADARREAETQMRQASPIILDTVLNMHRQLSRQTLELIGERKGRTLAEAQLAEILQRQSEDRYRAVFDSSSDGILVVDIESARVTNANQAACELFSHAESELIGRHVTQLHPAELEDEVVRAFNRFAALESDLRLFETWIRRGDGKDVPVEISGGRQFTSESGRHVVAVLRDTSARLAAQRHLEYLAYHDPLTGLGNRSRIVETIARLQSPPAGDEVTLALVILDIDHFSHINDVHGQQFGDEVLVRLARCWEDLLGAECPLARLGGDEFVVVATGLSDQAEAHQLAARLIEAGKELGIFKGKPLSISLSAGITYFASDRSADILVEPEILLRQANQAMYQAKLKGRGRFEEFDAEQESVIQRQHETINGLRAALDNDELTLHYQPKVNLRTGQILGVEALIRWQHPEQGLLMPAAFLPAVEDHPLSIPLGEWIIETALRQLQTWIESGLNLTISVNIGSLQLQDDKFPQTVQRLLNGFPDIDPQSLELEILESGALKDMQRATDNMAALRALGALISIDDFGTGYSSLTYLKQIPAHLLKIDRSFVHDMIDEPSELPLLIGIITMADSFGMKVLAEGVETIEQGRLLLELGCEQAQGYCIARPMAADQVPIWMRQWVPDPGWRGIAPILRRDLAAIGAISAHRRWIKALQAPLPESTGIQPAPPQDSCVLTDWLDSQQPDSARTQATLFDDIRQLHERMHDLVRSCPGSTAMQKRNAHIKRVQALQDELVVKLRNLLQSRARNAAD